MNTKVKQLGPQFSTWTCDHSRVKPWCLSHKYGCLSHKYGIGHRMDDLSYFREEREWAAWEDDNSRKKKARWGGRAWRELLFPCSQSHFDCWSIETLKNWFGPYWDCLLLLLGQTIRVDSKNTWNGKTAARTLNAFGLKQKNIWSYWILMLLTLMAIILPNRGCSKSQNTALLQKEWQAWTLLWPHSGWLHCKQWNKIITEKCM